MLIIKEIAALALLSKSFYFFLARKFLYFGENIIFYQRVDVFLLVIPLID